MSVAASRSVKISVVFMSFNKRVRSKLLLPSLEIILLRSISPSSFITPKSLLKLPPVIWIVVPDMEISSNVPDTFLWKISDSGILIVAWALIFVELIYSPLPSVSTFKVPMFSITKFWAEALNENLGLSSRLSASASNLISALLNKTLKFFI